MQLLIKSISGGCSHALPQTPRHGPTHPACMHHTNTMTDDQLLCISDASQRTHALTHSHSLSPSLSLSLLHGICVNTKVYVSYYHNNTSQAHMHVYMYLCVACGLSLACLIAPLAYLASIQLASYTRHLSHLCLSTSQLQEVQLNIQWWTAAIRYTHCVALEPGLDYTRCTVQGSTPAINYQGEICEIPLISPPAPLLLPVVTTVCGRDHLVDTCCDVVVMLFICCCQVAG